MNKLITYTNYINTNQTKSCRISKIRNITQYNMPEVVTSVSKIGHRFQIYCIHLNTLWFYFICIYKNRIRAVNSCSPSISQCWRRTINRLWVQALLLSLSAQSRPTLWNPIDYSLPRFSVHATTPARILEKIAIFSSRGSSRPKDRPCVFCSSCIGRWILYHWATWEALYCCCC